MPVKILNYKLVLIAQYRMIEDFLNVIFNLRSILSHINLVLNYYVLMFLRVVLNIMFSKPI